MVEPYFPPHTLHAIIGGTSGLDVPRLLLEDEAQAGAFLDAYGLTWRSHDERDEVGAIRTEALAFLRDYLLDPGEEVPRQLRETTDARQLLLFASGPLDDPLQNWSCALLRVMHTLAHCGSHLERLYGSDIRDQILARFRPHLRPDEDIATSLGGEIPLAGFEMKQGKSRRSTLLKLLHKSENVASDVFDRVGVRFVTFSRVDALRVVRYLRVHNVIIFANIKPTRSRNSLIDLAQIDLANLGDAQVAAMSDDDLPYPGAPDPDNPFSSVSYRSIQFTCRQLIRSRGARFFFPFEVQILDIESYEASRSGLASHAEYKKRQRDAGRHRVLGRLLGQDVSAPRR